LLPSEKEHDGPLVDSMRDQGKGGSRGGTGAQSSAEIDLDDVSDADVVLTTVPGRAAEAVEAAEAAEADEADGVTEVKDAAPEEAAAHPLAAADEEQREAPAPAQEVPTPITHRTAFG
jgi:hypothetical protein